MIIKKLELQGFKSFPERTRIVFHSGITAIVGPNGTGKSNIVDAILWVLGGQRHKGLRGEKTEDIIFNGNAKKPPLGMADVSLSLEHQEEEILINHRVFRSGESEYRLNGKAARLKDIQDALWKRAVAEKEYFVIEQGAIGSLLTAKPLEKRLLVEEAAGTAFYKDKKREAQSKLASSEQNLVRLEDIISEVGRAKNSLQRQAQAAARYRKLRERTRELTGLNFRRKLESLERRHEEAARQHGDGVVRERDLALRIKEEERELAARRSEVWDLEKAVKEDQEALFTLASELSRASSDREREAKRGELLAERGKKAEAAASEISQELARLASALEVRQSGLSELTGILDARREEIARATAASRLTSDGVGQREKSLQGLKSREFETLAELTELRNERVRAEKELELQSRQEAKLKAQLEQESALLEASEQSLRLIEGSLTEINDSRNEQERAAGDLLRSIEERDGQIARLRSRLEEAVKAREEDHYRLQALKKLEQSRRSTTGSAEIPAALGLLADLIETDPESASLVDTLWREEAGAAVIPALDFLERAAEEGLKGRYLLLPPTEAEDVEPAEIREPGVLGRIKSRLRPSPKIRPSLARLRDAVIVGDTRRAIDLWLRYPNLNFITLRGDLLLSSGLLKLGRGEDGAFVLGQEIKKLTDSVAVRDARIAPLAAELETMKLDRQTLEENRTRALSVVEQSSAQIREIENRKIRHAAERQKVHQAVTLYRQEVEVLERDNDSLRLKLSTLAERITGLEEENRSLRERVEAEEKEFLAWQGRNMEGEKRFIELRAAAVLAEERLSNANRQAEELLARKESLEKRLSSLGEEIRSAAAEEDEARQAETDSAARSNSLEEEKRARQAGLAGKEAELQTKHAEEQTREKTMSGLREELEKRKEERVRWEIIKAEIDRDMINLEETCWQELKKTLHELKAEQPQLEISEAEVEAELAQAEEDLQKYRTVNLLAEEEYLSHKERYDFLIQQKCDLRESIDATEEAIRRIDEESRSQFLSALAEVNAYFQEVFTSLFKGGSAEVKLSDEGNPMESGVEIIAQPPGKRVQNIALLSGGEKSLTSLAFLFALFRFKPTPFCILDEVDAALDDINLARFLDLMKEIKKSTQFIIITHNYKTMEVADFIYGTTMAEPNFTTIYSVKLERQPELTQ
jgi:chromosome segregation protein